MSLTLGRLGWCNFLRNQVNKWTTRWTQGQKERGRQGEGGGRTASDREMKTQWASVTHWRFYWAFLSGGCQPNIPPDPFNMTVVPTSVSLEHTRARAHKYTLLSWGFLCTPVCLLWFFSPSLCICVIFWHVFREWQEMLCCWTAQDWVASSGVVTNSSWKLRIPYGNHEKNAANFLSGQQFVTPEEFCATPSTGEGLQLQGTLIK